MTRYLGQGGTPTVPTILLATSVAVDPYTAMRGGQTATQAWVNAIAFQQAADNRYIAPTVMDYSVTSRLSALTNPTRALRIKCKRGTRLLYDLGTSDSGISGIFKSSGNLGTGVALSASVAAGDMLLTTASLPSTLVVGDYVKLRSDAILWNSAGETGELQGEALQVESITGSGPYTIRFTTPIGRAYLTTDNAAVQKMNLAAGVELSGLTFVNLRQYYGAAPVTDFKYLKRIRVHDCEAFYCDNFGFKNTGCVDGDIDVYGEDFTDVPSGQQNAAAPGLTHPRSGYLVSLYEECRDFAVRVRAKRVRHGFTTSGGDTGYGEPVNVVVTGQVWEASDAAFDTHQQGQAITFKDCAAFGARFCGFHIRARNTKLIGPIVDGASVGLRINGIADGLQVHGGAFSRMHEERWDPTVQAYVPAGDPNSRGHGVMTDRAYNYILIDGLKIVETAKGAFRLYSGTGTSTGWRIRNVDAYNCATANVAGEKPFIRSSHIVSNMRVQACSIDNAGPGATAGTTDFIFRSDVAGGTANYGAHNQVGTGIGNNHASGLTTMTFHDTNTNGVWA